MKPAALPLGLILAAALGSLGASCKETPVVKPEPLPTSTQTTAPTTTTTARVEVAPTASEASTSAAAAGPSAEALPPGVTGVSLAQKAETCWASPTCPLDEATALFHQADRAGATPMNCFRFYYAMGVPASPDRARRCFERMVKEEKGCGKESPSFERTYLAAMLLDGQGGPAALDRSKELLKDCLDDMSVTGLREEITKREAGDKPGKPLDFCEDIGGTTLSMRWCAALDEARGEFEEHKLMKALGAKLDADGLVLAKKAAAAWLDYADKDAYYATDMYRNGSLRPQLTTGRRAAREKERRDALQMIFEYTLGSDDPAEAEKALDKEVRAAAAAATDAESRKLLADAQSAWRAYRAAEVAFYRRALGKKLGEREVERDLRARLARARIVNLKDKISMEN